VRLLLTIFLLLPLPALAESAYDRVIKSGTLRCGYWVLPPFSLKNANTGEMVGFSVALIEEMTRQLNLKVEWTEEVTFGTMFEGLSTGRYDAICSGVYLAGSRARVMEYTSPYMYSVILPTVRADETRFDAGLEAMNRPGVKVAVQGALGEKFLKDIFPKAEGIVMPDASSVAEILLGLAGGKYDIVPLEPAGLRDFNAKNNNSLKLLEMAVPLRSYPWVIAVAKGEHDLASLLNAALLEMDYNGEVKRLAGEHNMPIEDFLFNAHPMERR
jgi:ABC-type amino acid transport substrate-binding protein